MLHPSVNRKLKQQGKNRTKSPMPRPTPPGHAKGSPSLSSSWPPKPMPHPSALGPWPALPATIPRRPVTPKLLPRLNLTCSASDGPRRPLPTPPPTSNPRPATPYGGSGVHEPRRAVGRSNPQQIGTGSDRRRLSEPFLRRSRCRRPPLGRRLGYGRDSPEEEMKRENRAAAETCVTGWKKGIKTFF
jgi:hypothetical protein